MRYIPGGVLRLPLFFQVPAQTNSALGAIFKSFEVRPQRDRGQDQCANTI